MRGLRAIALLSLTVACSGGRAWVRDAPGQTDSTQGSHWLVDDRQSQEPRRARFGAPSAPSEEEGRLSEDSSIDAQGSRPLIAIGATAGRRAPEDAELLGVFRNTYYDFPAERDFSGATTFLMNASCKPIAEVPRPFFEALCVQGSGTLRSGSTVSFAKRDCACAEVCPRTGQKLCFDVLDPASFPWGRGALGKPITPLRSVAVDSSVIPLGTVLYIPEFHGVARDPEGTPHDGCFVAEDRGMKVVGAHIDVFTGDPNITSHLNQLIPSNRGVHVYRRARSCD